MQFLDTGGGSQRVRTSLRTVVIFLKLYCMEAMAAAERRCLVYTTRVLSSWRACLAVASDKAAKRKQFEKMTAPVRARKGFANVPK